MEPHSNRERPFSRDTEDPGPAGQAKKKNLQQNAQESSPAALAPQVVEAPAEPTFLQALGKLFRGQPADVASADVAEAQETTVKETLQALLAEHEKEGVDLVIAPEERNMLRNILRFGEMTVNDIMIPRTDIVAVEYGISIKELKQVFVEQQHSRMPVYQENLDAIAGFLHIKDIAVGEFSGTVFSMEDSIRRILFVPPSMKLMDLLIKMRQSSVLIAVVIDEYGGTDGLVTMEDIVEEIVGDIHDEHDGEEHIDDFVWVSERVIEADARMHIDELEKCFGPSVVLLEDEEDVDTVGGLVFSHLGHVPEEGEDFVYPTGLRITVLEAEPRAIKRLRIERLEKQGDDSPQLVTVK